MDLDDTLTGIDFKLPLLDPNEDRFVASLQSEADLSVDGLQASLMSRLLGLFRGER